MGDDGPPFSPRQLGDMLLEYYRFLTTLHFNRADLRVPPEAGWPQLTDEYCADFKAPFALETLRHLPFWQSADNDLEYLQIAEYNSRFINYLALSSAEFAEFDTKLYPYYEGDREAGADFQQDPDRSHCILLAKGSETGGVNLILDTYRGVIIKDMVAMDVNSHDIKEYLDGLQDNFRTLQFIPSSVGRVTLDGDDVAEATERITEQQLVDQRFREGEDEPDWGTDLECSLCGRSTESTDGRTLFRRRPPLRLLTGSFRGYKSSVVAVHGQLYFWTEELNKDYIMRPTTAKPSRAALSVTRVTLSKIG